MLLLCRVCFCDSGEDISFPGRLGRRMVCTTAHPLYTTFTNIFGASISEARLRPNPRRRGSRGRRGRCAKAPVALSLQKKKYRLAQQIWCEMDARWWCEATTRPDPQVNPVALLTLVDTFTGAAGDGAVGQVSLSECLL